MYIAGSKVISKGNTTVNKDTWYKLNLNIQVSMYYICKYTCIIIIALEITYLLQRGDAAVQLDGGPLASVKVSAKAGFVGIGTSSFIRAAFDSILISDGE